jgi:hypothetical protein
MEARTSMSEPLKVLATWDPEGQVWVAESEDVPGLVTGAETIPLLVEKLRVLIPELLELNGIRRRTPEVPIEILARYHETLHLVGGGR